MDATSVISWACVIAAIIAYTTWWFHRIGTMVRRWAEQSGMKLVSYSVLPLPPNPPARIVFRTSRGQAIVRVRVYDADLRRMRHGWLRVGSYWWGLLSGDAVEMFWADEQGPAGDRCF